MDVALSMIKKLSDSDPGIAIEYSRRGLRQHRAASGLATKTAMKADIAAAIVGAGMTAVDIPGGGTSHSFFTGSMKDFSQAVTALVTLHWARRVVGQDDIAVFYVVTPKGANNVAFDVIGLFNG